MESWHGRWLQCLIDLWDVRGCRKASQLSVIQYANESRWTVGGVVHGLVGARCASNPQPPLHTNWDKFINFSLARSTGSCCSTLSKQRGPCLETADWSTTQWFVRTRRALMDDASSTRAMCDWWHISYCTIVPSVHFLYDVFWIYSR